MSNVLKMSFPFEKLPEKLQIQIISHLTYTDLAKLRLVNSWFKENCSEMLNEAFTKVKWDLDHVMSSLYNEINLKEVKNEEIDKIEIENNVKHLSTLQLRYKILQILKCEISCLHAVCLRHIKLKLYSFTGGQILDYFYDIMNKNFSLTDAKNPLESHITMQLFLLNEEFMDYFEEVIEPIILNKNYCPWFGVKITDIIDLYANSNYHITASYQHEKLQIVAKYEVLNPENATRLDFPDSSENLKKLFRLSKYVRNEMRWHNFFYYVDSPYDTVKDIKRDRRYNKLCLNSPGFIEDGAEICIDDEIGCERFTRTFSRRLGNPRTAENICYSIELQCNKNFVPTRFEPSIESVTKNNDARSDDENRLSQAHNPVGNDETPLVYDMLMTAKVVIASDDESIALETFVELLHTNRMLKFVETVKEIPIF